MISTSGSVKTSSRRSYTLEIWKEVNLGSLAHSTGKVVVTKAVAMGKEDVETFEKLIDKGVTFNVRKVPSDSPENMGEMLKKAKAELK